MAENQRKLVIGLIVVIAAGLMYGWWVYSSLVRERWGYVYDPKSDRVFEVRMERDWPVFKSELLMPFKGTDYYRIKYARYSGNLRELIKKVEEEKKLDHEEWEKQFKMEIAEDIKRNSIGMDDWDDWWDMIDYSREGVNVGELLPEEMGIVREVIMRGKREAVVREIVAIHYLSRWLGDGEKIPYREERSELEVEVIENGILITGENAVYEMRHLLGMPYESEISWEN